MLVGISADDLSNVMRVMNTVQGSFTPADEDLTDDSPDYGDDDIMEIRKRLSSCSELLTEDVLDGECLILFLNTLHSLVAMK